MSTISLFGPSVHVTLAQKIKVYVLQRDRRLVKYAGAKSFRAL